MKNTVIEYFNSVSFWFQSWNFIFKNGLVHFFLYPILITILLSMGSLVLIKNLVSLLMDHLAPIFDQKAPDPDSSVWQNVVNFIFEVSKYAITAAVFLLSFYTFNRIKKYLVLSLMSPVMARLSEKTEQILTGRVEPFNMKQFTKDVVRGLLISFRNFIIEFSLMIAIWAVSLILVLAIPPLAIIVAPISALSIFLIGSYFYGFSVFDYYNERHRLSVRASIKEIRRKKGAVAGIGTIFSLLFMIPFIGTTIATVTCTVASVLQKLDDK